MEITVAYIYHSGVLVSQVLIVERDNGATDSIKVAYMRGNATGKCRERGAEFYVPNERSTISCER